MSTLLLRLAAPIQAWGIDNKFERRGTMREPTKSGVIGLLAAALGRQRDENIDDLACLRFGVRADQPGQLLHDYHIARNDERHLVYVTHRYYLADAVFLAGVEGDDVFIRTLNAALHTPVFSLYLGRRSCPPTGRVSLGIRDYSLEEALYSEPWQASDWYRKHLPIPSSLTVTVDAKQPGGLRRRDLPLSFSQAHRKYSFRYMDDQVVSANQMKDVFIDDPNNNIGAETKHDPLVGLEG